MHPAKFALFQNPKIIPYKVASKTVCSNKKVHTNKTVGEQRVHPRRTTGSKKIARKYYSLIDNRLPRVRSGPLADIGRP